MGNVVSWNDVLELGKKESDQGLDIREGNQAVNKACMYMYTSGTTGPPKGINCNWKIKIFHYYPIFKLLSKLLYAIILRIF